MSGDTGLSDLFFLAGSSLVLALSSFGSARGFLSRVRPSRRPFGPASGCPFGPAFGPAFQPCPSHFPLGKGVLCGDLYLRPPRPPPSVLPPLLRPSRTPTTLAAPWCTCAERGNRIIYTSKPGIRVTDISLRIIYFTTRHTQSNITTPQKGDECMPTDWAPTTQVGDPRAPTTQVGDASLSPRRLPPRRWETHALPPRRWETHVLPPRRWETRHSHRAGSHHAGGKPTRSHHAGGRRVTLTARVRDAWLPPRRWETHALPPRRWKIHVLAPRRWETPHSWLPSRRWETHVLPPRRWETRPHRAGRRSRHAGGNFPFYR